MLPRDAMVIVFAPLLAMVAVGAAALLLEDMRITLANVPLFLAFLALLWHYRAPSRRNESPRSREEGLE